MTEYFTPPERQMINAHTVKQIVENIGSQNSEWGWQRKLAKEIGISDGHLSQILHGTGGHRRGPPTRMLKKLGYDPTPYYRKK